MGHWQNQAKLEVKRYIHFYSASSIIGLSAEDLLHISNLYAQTEENRSRISKNLSLNKNENYIASLPVLRRKIDAYFDFLSSVADLAYSKWTEFNIETMSIDLGIMVCCAAFIGFDEFILIRQAILLTIDTFGFSHFLPIFGLPFLVACQYLLGLIDHGKTSFVRQLSHMICCMDSLRPLQLQPL